MLDCCGSSAAQLVAADWACGLCSSLVCVVMYSGQCPVVCVAVWCVLLCTVVNVLWSV